MKLIKSLIVGLFCLVSAQAATVTLSAGFGATSGIVVTLDGATTPYTLEVGGFEGGLFTVMPSNAGAVSKAAGDKIAGVFSTLTDNAGLSGDAIFTRVTVGSYTAILSRSGAIFPTLTSGTASQSVTMSNSSVVGVAGFSGTGLTEVSFSNPNTLNFVAIPEPSTALLGLLGIAGLIRRRR